jgi:ribonuclease HI
MAEKKFYVVWEGHIPGVYDTWEACKEQVYRCPSAKYKSFPSYEKAVKAFERGYEGYVSAGKCQLVSELVKKVLPTTPEALSHPPLENALAVDAACSGNPGKMEYQGVYVGNRQRLFHVGPMDQGTNNIGEFLALVHGLAYLKKNNFNMPIYTDSANAIAWVRQKKCNTKLERTEVNRPIFDLIERAEKWLQTNSYQTQILKWETSIWGEIPADFGRK